MAKKEEPIVDSETGSLKVKEKLEKQPDSNETINDVTKVKTKMKIKPEIVEETVTKVDMNKPPKPEENEIENDDADNSGVVDGVENADTTQEQEEVQQETEAQEGGALEEITEEDVTKEDVMEVLAEAEATGKPLPENVQKLVDFIDDTGGDINDYVKLNQNFDDLDNDDLLHEFYKQTKPHLDSDEISFLMEDEFSYDEDIDSDRDIKKKKIALKEQVANAKSHLDGLKSKYYQ